MKLNIVISRSQQSGNRCILGDTEQQHCGLIADAIETILQNDERLNVCNIPELTGTDTENLIKTVDLSNEFIRKNGGTGYHLALHTDGGYQGSGATGCYFSDSGYKFGKPIFDEMVQLTPWSDMRLEPRQGLYELRKTEAVAFLLEISFHDNPEQSAWIHNNTDAIATAIVRGMYKAWELEQPHPAPEPEVEVEISEMTVEEAINILANEGIIRTPEYWMGAGLVVKNLDKLLLNVADNITRRHNND